MAAGLAGSSIILLFVLALAVENPEATLYQKTVARLMAVEGHSNQEALEAQHPILQDIQVNLEHMADLNQLIRDRHQHPAPPLEAEGLQLDDLQNMVEKVRQQIRAQLYRLQLNCSTQHP